MNIYQSFSIIIVLVIITVAVVIVVHMLLFKSKCVTSENWCIVFLDYNDGFLKNLYVYHCYILHFHCISKCMCQCHSKVNFNEKSTLIKGKEKLWLYLSTYIITDSFSVCYAYNRQRFYYVTWVDVK